jgi:hypothetical protein
MTVERATNHLYDLASQMNLPVPAGPESKAAEAPKAPEQPDIYNYYTGYGPPIITYYPPPYPYFYLYAWVPYPFWWYGYWYPGFYVCNNFSTTVVVDSRTAYVRNRFVDPVTKRVVRVDPVVRTGRDTVRPETILRTNDGRTFRNIREMRQGIVYGDVQQGGRGARAIRPPGGAGGFTSLEQRRSAQDILRRSIERQGIAGQVGQSNGYEKRRSPQGAGGGSYTGQPLSGKRSYEKRAGDVAGSAGAPGRSQRSYDYPTRRGSGQFEGSATGGGPRPPVMSLPPRHIPAPSMNQQRSHGWVGQGRMVSPAAPGPSSGQQSFPPPSRGDQGMSNSPRFSR